MRTHLNVRATVTVVEMRDPTAAPNTAHWGISIVPTSGTTQVVYLTGTDWTMHWEEAVDMVTFLRGATNEPPLHYSLLIHDKADFMRLLYYCSNIRMYMYTGTVLA
ncbi:uncharacterized protein TRAVEDRAFT_43537 [Trametes versicolor FP-101664 SS1]|uniref:uncharacterized protein n=1 Tax=Trametes versicolor (strain FP-101664) TaxID=717944 RepID=UPI000462138E|nr:uncharacterized protein TRAVEDRAFT_43537 [Trametes versicolor FP-101664 SS1]EIW63232.1 hypothetical protein TRAVEDRAFT_43537 [Trametes versicolor FP-101664 SS1]